MASEIQPLAGHHGAPRLPVDCDDNPEIFGQSYDKRGSTLSTRDRWVGVKDRSAGESSSEAPAADLLPAPRRGLSLPQRCCPRGGSGYENGLNEDAIRRLYQGGSLAVLAGFAGMMACPATFAPGLLLTTLAGPFIVSANLGLWSWHGL